MQCPTMHHKLRIYFRRTCSERCDIETLTIIWSTALLNTQEKRKHNQRRTHRTLNLRLWLTQADKTQESARPIIEPNWGITSTRLASNVLGRGRQHRDQVMRLRLQLCLQLPAILATIAAFIALPTLGTVIA